VEDDTDALFLQGFDLVKDIHHAAVVRRIGDVEAYEMDYSTVGGAVHKWGYTVHKHS
jgi:hypothetical protein